MNAARALAVAAALAGAPGTAAAAPADDVATLAAWWPGIYDTAEQLVFSTHGVAGRAEGSELRVRTIVSRIAVPWLGRYVLYVEEFLHDDPENLRRQVLLRWAHGQRAHCFCSSSASATRSNTMRWAAQRERLRRLPSWPRRQPGLSKTGRSLKSRLSR